MTNAKLGLPLEYRKLPQYFDTHNICADTESKNAIIEKLLRENRVKTVLDMTCGTGSQVFFLHKRGYEITGSDFSPALLEQARKKAQEENIALSFIDGDMRKLNVGEFDAVITMFNAIGHLTKIGFGKALHNIHKNLKTGGIYLFDILNLQALTDAVVAKMSMQVSKQIEDSHIYTIQVSTMDRDNGRLVSYDTIVIQKNADKPQIINHRFALQIYTAKELREILSENGFETIKQCAMDGSPLIEAETQSIVTVAKKTAN